MATRPPMFRPAGHSRQPTVKSYEQRRGSAHERGYSRKWSAAADGFRDDNPLCIGCEAVDRVTASALVDHIEPHKGDQKLFWNRRNWQASCKWHHDVVKARLETMWQRGEVGKDALHLDSPEAKAMTLRLGVS